MGRRFLKNLPRIFYQAPWWWKDFIAKLRDGEVYAKGEKGDKGESAEPFSIPPANCFKVTNIYVDNNGKLVVKYDDQPIL